MTGVTWRELRARRLTKRSSQLGSEAQGTTRVSLSCCSVRNWLKKKKKQTSRRPRLVWHLQWRVRIPRDATHNKEVTFSGRGWSKEESKDGPPRTTWHTRTKTRSAEAAQGQERRLLGSRLQESSLRADARTREHRPTPCRQLLAGRPGIDRDIFKRTCSSKREEVPHSLVCAPGHLI